MQDDMNNLPAIHLNDIEADVLDGQTDIEELLALLESEIEDQ